MAKVISDIDLSQKVSSDVHDNYITALEFINSNPDYSLLKFREIVSIIVNLVAKNSNEVHFNNEKLVDRIKFLSERRLISQSLQQNLHEVRKLGNKGAHVDQVYQNVEDEKELQKIHELQKSRKRKLEENARQARKIVVLIFKDVYDLIEGESVYGEIELSSEGLQEHRQTLYAACTSTCPKLKLKAGIICETILTEQQFKTGLVTSSDLRAHLEQLKNNAINFYDASCKISANISQYYLKNYYLKNALSKDAELIIQQNAELEALFKYANLVKMYESSGSELYEKALGRVKAAADREYGAAESLYGVILYENEEYQEALKYLERGAKQDEPLALRALYVAYSEGKGFKIESQKAIKFLKQAIELGCPDSVAMLGEVYHKGEIIQKDDKKAQDLLQQSIDMGSFYGQSYVMIDNLPKAMAKSFQILTSLFNDMKQKPIRREPKPGRNSLCPCGSKLKYKKCCGKNS